MPDENALKELVRVLSQSKILVSADVRADVLEGVEVDLLASKLIDTHKADTALAVINETEIRQTIEGLRVDKAPLPVEVIRSADFKPYASDIDARYSISNKPAERAEGTTADFVSYFRDRLAKTKRLIGEHRRDGYGHVQTLDMLKNFADGKEVMIVGVVTNRVTTKKGHTMVILEDETSEVRVLFINGTSQQARQLTERANTVIQDEVIAVKGKISGIFVMANEVVWPDIPIREKKKVEEDVAIAFMSDIHIGSKRFMQKNFQNMLEWINGSSGVGHRELAGKIKYIVMAGDVVDGIGVYPGQERDLAIFDIYAQYKELFDYIDTIPDYIHVFVLPGNHDAVQRAEPQPPLTSDLLRDFKKDNVHIVSNPSNMTLHGLDVLAYHGTSLASMISAIPGMSFSQPERVMIEVLKRRHISPVYGGNVIVPSKEDNLVIEKVPDILHMGHVHKNGIANYHGVEVVNSGTWQSITDYQISQGLIPTPCILPVYEAKSHAFTSLSFTNE